MITETLIKVVAFILVAALTITIALYMRPFATTLKHKIAILAPILLVMGVSVALLMMLLGGDGRYAAFIVVSALSIMGVIFIVTANESAELYSSLRTKGGIWKWIVNEVPKRESFLFRGWALTIIGSAAIIWFIYLTM
jgi:hypothetical protein